VSNKECKRIVLNWDKCLHVLSVHNDVGGNNMNSPWENEFRHRIETFEIPFSAKGKGKAISIKVRVTGGCFHREHSPNACRIIDAQLESYHSHEREFSFIEHESGPELLVYVALGTAGITLAKSVIDLITAIIKARSEGAKKGVDMIIL
jgi:hypothetical protein